MKLLGERGHEVVAASPSTGVNAVTGEGLAEALTGARVVVDVANAPSWEDKAVLEFFEFVGGIAQTATEGQTVRVPSALMQPIAADDVAAVMSDVALAKPLNGTFDLAGPETIRQDELVRQFLKATGDPRKVTADPKALYYGLPVNDQSLTPGPNPRLGPTRFQDWLKHSLHSERAVTH